MVERRAIRVLVPYSRTLYFNDKGRARGLTADFVSDFERYINQKYRKQLGKRRSPWSSSRPCATSSCRMSSTGSEEYQRFESTLALFRQYGEQYGFDSPMLAAQGYQESRLKSTPGRSTWTGS